MTKQYIIKCKKGQPTPSRSCFIMFGKGRKKITGEVTKVTRPDTLGEPEKRVEIIMTASGGYTQNDIIESLKIGKYIKKSNAKKREDMIRGY